MNILLLGGLVFGLLGATPGQIRPVVYQASTYECSACDTCDSCGDACDDSCGTPCGRGACSDRTPCGPLTLLFSIFNCNTWRGPSCGERYWGDFYSDPPACHDPCDPCGNYVGRSNSTYHWGNAGGYYDSGSSGSGCINCNKNRTWTSDPIPMQEGRVVRPATKVSRQPTPVKQTIRSVPPKR
jgi:hypothetical protein